MTQKQKRIYRKAYALLEHRTPLRVDCGALCSAACCKGDDETGMLLFPGETTPFRVLNRNGRRLAVCSGHCARRNRPLGCRIFPFLPAPDRRGRWKAQIDPRGFGVCPLVRLEQNAAFSHRFLHRVGRVGRLLSGDRRCRAFLSALWKEAEAQRALLQQISAK